MNEATRSLLPRRKEAAQLDDVRARLQHYLRAMYGSAITIESLTPTKEPGATTRAFRKLAKQKEHGVSESDADRIKLPATLPSSRADVSPLERYRMIAVQHAERIRRESAVHAREASTDLERDLFQIAEAAAVDTQIAANQPGLRTTLEAARADAIAQRPTPRRRTGIERRVEEIFRGAWSSHRSEADDLPTLLPANDAESNAEWARRTARALETKYGADAARGYRRMPEMTLWDTTITTRLPDDDQAPENSMQVKKRPRDPWRDSRDTGSGSAMHGSGQSSISQNKGGGTAAESEGRNATSRVDAEGEVPRGNESEPDREGNAAAGAAGDTSDGSAESNTSADTEGQGSEAGMAHPKRSADDATLTEEKIFRYPEWDVHARAFNSAGTIVHLVPPTQASAEWATSALSQHAREVHQAKRQFELLRSLHVRLRRQIQGDELDLEACVEAMVDRAMHVAPTDRLYSVVRPGRRELAITLLLDVSGSTREVVVGEQRVIDIERIATLVATAAFDALGDDYSIFAFSSEGATNVRVYPLKTFAEKNSSAVLQRISALVPHGTTRLGAAVRHATTMLSGHPAPHQLLLIISDGKPHDFGYATDYAIQDSRHAVMNARLQGIHPFCITVDASEGETYLAEIFGSAGYRVVSRPSQLSQALLLAVQRLIGGSN